MSKIPETTLDPTAVHDAKQFKYNRQFLCCRFSPCGQYVFGGAFDGSLQRWHLEDDANPVDDTFLAGRGDVVGRGDQP